MFSSGRDDGGDGGVFDVDLATHVSSTVQRRSRFLDSFLLGPYYIVVHFDIHDIILYEVVGGGEAPLGHVNFPLLVVGFAR
jgi:hypothetical protein